MASEVLRSQDCLKGVLPLETLTSSPLRRRRSSNPRQSSSRSSRRKRSLVGLPDKDKVRDRRPAMVVSCPRKEFVMGEVTILKRGEELKPTMNQESLADEDVIERKIVADEDLVPSFSDRLVQERETIRKQIRFEDEKCVREFYAGSSVTISPPPSSLPFPAFCTKEGVWSKTDAASTADLRRLLPVDAT